MGSNQRRFRWVIRSVGARNDPKSSKKTDDRKKWSENQTRNDETHVHCARHVRMYETTGLLDVFYLKPELLFEGGFR